MTAINIMLGIIVGLLVSGVVYLFIPESDEYKVHRFYGWLGGLIVFVLLYMLLNMAVLYYQAEGRLEALREQVEVSDVSK